MSASTTPPSTHHHHHQQHQQPTSSKIKNKSEIHDRISSNFNAINKGGLDNNTSEELNFIIKQETANGNKNINILKKPSTINISTSSNDQNNIVNTKSYSSINTQLIDSINPSSAIALSTNDTIHTNLTNHRQFQSSPITPNSIYDDNDDDDDDENYRDANFTLDKIDGSNNTTTTTTTTITTNDDTPDDNNQADITLTGSLNQLNFNDSESELDEKIPELKDRTSPLMKLLFLNSSQLLTNKKLLELRDIAESLYLGNFKIDRKYYLTFLSGGNITNLGNDYNFTDFEITVIRYLYMTFYRWKYSLLSSLRLLCDRLFFRGESQHIDTILDCFSESWFHVYGNTHQKNQESVFGSTNGVYLVSYALILLNTDLHTAEIEKKKRIDKNSFIKNTITALNQNKVRLRSTIKVTKELKSFYEDLAINELKLDKALNSDFNEDELTPLKNTNSYNHHHHFRSSKSIRNNNGRLGTTAASLSSPTTSISTVTATPNGGDTSTLSSTATETPTTNETFSQQLPSSNNITSSQSIKSSSNPLSLLANRRKSSSSRGFPRPSIDRESIYSNDSRHTNTTSMYNYQMGAGANTIAPSVNSNASFGFTKALLNDRKFSNKNQSTGNDVQSKYSFQESKINRLSVVLDENDSFEFQSAIDTGATMGENTNNNDNDNDDDDDEEDGAIDSDNEFVIKEKGDLELELQGPPWVKEGLLYTIIPEEDILNVKSNQTFSSSSILTKTRSNVSSAKSTFHWFTSLRSSSNSTSSNSSNSKKNWNHLFVVVSKGELRVFSFDDQASFANFEETVGGGNWYDNANTVASYNLCSCFAQVINPKSKAYRNITATHGDPVASHKKTGYETYWCLTLPLDDSSKLSAQSQVVFCSGTKEVAQEYVDTCNFWSARSSAIPPEDAISSIEYGWTERFLSMIDSNNIDSSTQVVEYLKKTRIGKWTPLSPSLAPASYQIVEQLKLLNKYFDDLNGKVKNHASSLESLHKLDQIYKNKLINSGHHQSRSFFSRSKNSSADKDTVKLNQVANNNYKQIKLNYENRSIFLENEQLRFKGYINSLISAIEIRNAKLYHADEGDN
ncbi:hypothetical protein B5S33_g4502 [[Candida] boidinii]|nr:hypothetical protein B5S30_g4288 [[Candida] boidinii]OWB85829.1 hypothetical protein B5S33_g4502 [[Candida] boidinii]